MHSAVAVIRLVSAIGRPIIVIIGRKYTAASPAKADLLPLVNFMESKIIRKGLYFGK